jgi:transposase-like protein
MICYHCSSDKVHKHGLTSNGKQRWQAALQVPFVQALLA